MPAGGARYFCTVDVQLLAGAIASVIVLEFVVDHYANVKEAVLTMIESLERHPV